MSTQAAIEVRGVEKSFRRDLLSGAPSASLKSVLTGWFRRRAGHDRVRVLDNINLSVSPGSTLAIIGHNGSGKSTLLKIIAGIYRPDKGEVTVRGRVASLIELGTGFHPEFTGRENVYLNGILLGLSREEIDRRFQEIADYAGLGDYIDAPVKTYSSGMYVRLGFSVAVSVEPDIVIVDEVLAVGDEAFVHKCEDKIYQLKRDGKAIVLVSHNLGLVEKFADEVIWLDGGCLAARGKPRPVIDAYLNRVAASEDLTRRQSCQMVELEGARRWGNGDVVLEAVRICDQDGRERGSLNHGDALVVEMDYVMQRPVPEMIFGVALHNQDDVLCYACNTRRDRALSVEFPSKGTVRFVTERLDLVDGVYFLDAAVSSLHEAPYDHMQRAASFAVRSTISDDGIYRPPHHWELADKDGKRG
jgi:ABC-type polysaccharide/polyol phosphate transport system ATPase subunit